MNACLEGVSCLFVDCHIMFSLSNVARHMPVQQKVTGLDRSVEANHIGADSVLVPGDSW